MERDNLNDVQHLTARVAALELLVKLLLASNASRTPDPIATLTEELKGVRSSAQLINRPIDPASDATWDEMFRTIERLYREVRSRFEPNPPSA